MKTRLHRIAVAVKDLDKAIAVYEKLTGGKFHRTGEAVAKEAGVHVAAAMDVGIELVSPVKGSDNPITKNLEALLESRGDGICGIGICTDDMDATIRSAGELGIKPLRPTFAFSQEQLDQEFNGLFSKFEECPLDSAAQLGFIWAANSIEESPSRDPRTIVRRWWNAFERDDMDTVLSLMHDDAVWEVMIVGHLLPHNGIYRGKEMIAAELLPFAHQAYDMTHFKLDITSMYADGETVIMEFDVNAKTNTGRDYRDAKYISVVKVVEGKIKSAREYVDGVKALNVHFG